MLTITHVHIAKIKCAIYTINLRRCIKVRYKKCINRDSLSLWEDYASQASDGSWVIITQIEFDEETYFKTVVSVTVDDTETKRGTYNHTADPNTVILIDGEDGKSVSYKIKDSKLIAVYNGDEFENLTLTKEQ